MRKLMEMMEMASNTSPGSIIFFILSLLAISLATLLLLRHFLPLRTTPAFLLVPIFLSLALPVSIILLVPIDLASSSPTHDEAKWGIWLPERAVQASWRIAYWLTFALTWFILPLLGEYVDSGFRTPQDSMLYSLRSNARYQLIVLACGIVGLLYIFIQEGFHGDSIKSLVMALAYCWGLIQAIYLMGHGLVMVPRSLYRSASLGGRLRRLQSRAPGVHDSLEDSINDLEILEMQLAQLKQRKHEISRDHQIWIEELANLPSFHSSHSYFQAASITGATASPSVITNGYLADFGRKLNRARHQQWRYTEAMDRLVHEAMNTQAILDASASQQLEFVDVTSNSYVDRFIPLTPYIRYQLHSMFLPGLQLLFSGIFAFASVAIVWSELIKTMFPRLSLISYTVIYHDVNGETKVTLRGQAFASFWLIYMCLATLASFDDVKVWRNRALVRRNTYAEAACWYAGQIAKLTVPLAFNFVGFLPPSVLHNTTFYQFLGKLINFTPLGQNFESFFPIAILIPVCATLFNLYGRVKTMIGIDTLVGDDESENLTGYGTGSWRDGQAIIARELLNRSDLVSAPLSGACTPHGRLQRSLIPSAPSIRAEPSLHVPPAQRTSNVQKKPPSHDSNEDEDESVLLGFAHRVRNTFDSVERPEWLNRRPKWMGDADTSDETTARADAGGGLGRWFGGRSESRVRL